MTQFLNSLKYGKLVYHMIRLILNPNQTQALFSLNDVLFRIENKENINSLIARVFQNPEFRRDYEENYLPLGRSQSDLRHLPDGTLGREFARFLDDNKIEKDFYPKIIPKNKLEYILLRLQQTHDIRHVVLGYDTSLNDETALQAFNFAQYGMNFSSLIIGLSMIRISIVDSKNLHRLFISICDGYKRGLKTHFFLSVRWEECWHIPLADLRNKIVCPERNLNV